MLHIIDDVNLNPITT